MQQSAPAVGPGSWSTPESMTQSADSIRRRLDDLMNELAYIDEYPERWDSPHARAIRRVVVLEQIRHCRSLLPRIERRRLFS